MRVKFMQCDERKQFYCYNGLSHRHCMFIVDSCDNFVYAGEINELET